jgi:hypothetical protein
MTTFVFSTQFYPDQKNARPALNIGYFLVILVGNGMFYYFPHCGTFIFSNWVQKVHVVQKQYNLSIQFEISH